MEKDCGCITHEGAHWLHMQRFAIGQNRELLLRAIKYRSANGLRGFIQREHARLAELVREMERRGLEVVPEELRKPYADIDMSGEFTSAIPEGLR